MILKNLNIHDIEVYLKNNKIISIDQGVSGTEIPGKGNMNYVIRVKLKQGNLIMKQALPYVNKYPQVEAPEKRILSECRFYNILSSNANMKSMGPEILYLDSEHNILVMEDLGEMEDFTYIYQNNKTLANNEIETLMHYLTVLHRDFQSKEAQSPLKNLEMRKLNAEHIFNYPFLHDNGIDLDEVTQGLNEYKDDLANNPIILSRASELKDIYMSDGTTLLHGDYYPGSWLKSKNVIKVIDPEFGHYGYLEFDLGVMIAHLILSGHSDRQVFYALSQYQNNHDTELVNKFAGIEIIRRIIGLAQLPISLNLTEKASLLDKSVELLK